MKKDSKKSRGQGERGSVRNGTVGTVMIVLSLFCLVMKRGEEQKPSWNGLRGVGLRYVTRGLVMVLMCTCTKPLASESLFERWSI